jgi:Zn-finger nucleic acid-binding protein
MPEPVKGPACPKCHPEPMREETFEGVTVDRCKVCKGLYLDAGELDALIKAKLGSTADTFAFTATSEAMDNLKATCPKCNVAMEASTGPEGIRIDRCPSCHAVFLEQGELASLELARA